MVGQCPSYFLSTHRLHDGFSAEVTKMPTQYQKRKRYWKTVDLCGTYVLQPGEMHYTHRQPNCSGATSYNTHRHMIASLYLGCRCATACYSINPNGVEYGANNDQYLGSVSIPARPLSDVTQMFRHKSVVALRFLSLLNRSCTMHSCSREAGTR